MIAFVLFGAVDGALWYREFLPSLVRALANHRPVLFFFLSLPWQTFLKCVLVQNGCDA